MPDSRPATPAQRTGTPSNAKSPPKPSPPKLANGTGGTTPAPSPFALDVDKLHSLPSEQQDLYLLTFTSDLANHVDSLDAEGATNEQVGLKTTLFQIINLTSPQPARVIRNNLGRCFYGILTKGSRKILYESINDLVAILNNPSKESSLRCRHAAVSCLGAVFEAAGDSANSLSPLACTAIQKQFKAAGSDTGYRAALFRALGKIILGIRVAIDEDIARAIWKLARNAVGSDKSLLVQQQACRCLEELIQSTSYFDNSNDFEKLQSVVYKALDSSSVALRHAAASCFTAILVKSFSENPSKDGIPKLRKPKKAKKAPKTVEDLEEDIERASSPVPDKPATALSFSLAEILRILSAQYTKHMTSNKARAGLASVYVKVLRGLGESVVEAKYSDIARHFFNEILSFPGFVYAKYKQLISRKFVRIILEQAVGKMLGESAQLDACRFLINDIIKDYPQAVKERPEPSKQTLTGALSALTALIRDLEAAVSVIAEPTREGLLQALQHPSFTVQVHAARALRTFVLAVPQQLLPTLTICMNSVSRELSQISSARQSPRRCIGYAYGLAAVLSTSSQRPLHGSVDVYARVLQQATAILKSAGSSDLRISSCQIQVAWIMIGGLMSLGPTFVKIHLPQLMMLWKNSLPRPVAKENIAERNMLELSFLANVRECALGSIKAFLTFNQRLLTADISRRLAGMLENTVIFLQSLPEKKTSEELGNRITPTMQLQDYEVMVRRRVFQCFSQLLTLSPTASLDVSAHSSILPMAVASLCDVDYPAPSSLSAAIASAAGNFDTIWEVGDNVGFGVTGLVCGLDIRNPIDGKIERHWSSRQDLEDIIDQAILSPIGSSAECDGLSCYLDPMADTEDVAAPPATEAVNAAVAAFGLCLPLQAPKVQEGTLAQVASSMNASSLQKDTARRSAIMANIALALMTASKVSDGELGSARGDLKNQNTEKAMQSLLHSCLHESDETTRHMAASALGRLCSSSGNAFTSAEVAYLTDTIVKNREPHVRAGCALALASIHAQLGGMAAGFHMKNIVGIVMSLAADTHPLVHVWALDALARVAESAGLNFSGYVTSCLGMLGQLYVSDTHNVETASLGSSNMAMSLPVTASIARGVDAVINVVGPDLQDMTKARDMIINLIRLLSSEVDVGIQLESLRCMEHLSLYAPAHVEFEKYVRRLQAGIENDALELRQAALLGLFTVMRRDADEIVKIAHPGLEERLWDYLNSRPDQQYIRSIFINWLQHTGPSDPAGWIQRCNVILTKTKSKNDQPKTATVKETPGADLQDEEVAGFAVASGASKEEDTAEASAKQELMRWQVRLFAMECLQSLIAMISKAAAIRDDSPGEAALQQKVSEVIRIAFSASTSGVTSLRVVGLKIVDQILQMFGHTPDPDFPEAMLLEQYQAQISSALTPAFAGDSSPELAAEAVNVCASFIATGIVTDIDRMGRILKLLVSALDSFSRDSETASIGDLKGLSSNAQVMVRMAIFSAWAELQIASADHKYLVDVVKPHIARLVPLWLTSLREYSRLRFEPEISATTSALHSDDLDTVYAALNRQTLLKFYQDSWLSLVDAIASLIDEDSELVFDALDDKRIDPEKVDGNGQSDQVIKPMRSSTGIDYREEPVAFFFVLYGLAFESLAVRSSDDDVTTKQRNLDILQALDKILRPTVSGNAVYQEVVFAETMDLLDRMVLTESMSVQMIIVDIARNLCMAHPSSRLGPNAHVNGETLSDDIEQLFELTRIIVLVLAGLIPGLAETPVAVRLEMSDEAVALARNALQALVDVADVFPSIIKTDLHATILHTFVTILGTGACQSAVVPQALPVFRRFISSIVDEEREETQSQLRNTLARMQIILRNAQRRETEASLPCEKNTLLAITILLSTAPRHLPGNDMLVQGFINELDECLSAPTTSRIAAGCIRTLVMSNVAASTLLSEAIKFLLTPSDLEGIDESKALMGQTLTMYATKLPTQQRPPATAMFAKALLARAILEGPSTHQETAVRLLELAGADNTTFRALIASMDGEQRQTLEHILKANAGPRRTNDDFASREPTIALKMDF